MFELRRSFVAMLFLLIVAMVVLTGCVKIDSEDTDGIFVKVIVRSTENEEVEKVSPGLSAYSNIIENIVITVENEQGEVVYQSVESDLSKTDFQVSLPGYGTYKFTVEAKDFDKTTFMRASNTVFVGSQSQTVVLYYTYFNPYGTYYTYYKAYVIPVYKSLYKIIPFFEYSNISSNGWTRATPALYEIRKAYSGYPSIVLIHGIDSSEISGLWSDYKKDIINKWSSYVPKQYGLYFFAYPTLDVPLDFSASVLIQSINTLGSTLKTKFYFFAHSMGGLVFRYALQNPVFRTYVAKVIFSGTPHIGSPLGNLVVMDKNKLSSRSDWDLIKNALILANMGGVFVEAPNYRYLVYGVQHPAIPTGVTYKTFAGVVPYYDLASMINAAWSNGITNTLGHAIVAALMAKVFGSDFSKSDGAVPLQSASALGNTEVINGFTHYDLAINPTVISKAMKFFFNVTLSIPEEQSTN
ncbi:Lecithin:cholesterol acyltransferase [Fervidobacterium pennivorans DSM 9078]|uniref:Lecithin:cholesterol acyltransferase n=1 Tax=Fervidobacterium pennivorans (strain DSM 9078 / Ven5) TaxID=771875 RepID=H9UCR4_FERPD|nr:alpha/beta hydrolase [Fervidobacterium pennivorans]AFG35307.1 Lecithin:cholesterol acyltransferase [Fervidobacterium pennivorans DSM 9078]